jgi:hypothetical protein
MRTEGSMNKGLSLRGFAIALTLTLLIFIPAQISGAEISKGDVLGFVYAEDGTTPVVGAVVKARNISTGSIYESSASDTYGVFKITDIESGVYVYGVKTTDGEFNSEGMIGLSVNEKSTAKMAISLLPFTEEALSELKAGIEANNIDGENLIGRIIDFDPETQLAAVYILQHGLSQKDRIHTLGVETDFYQNVNMLKLNGEPKKNVEIGETASVKMNENAMQGDFVYLVAEKAFAALALVPIGAAVLIGGTASVVKVKKSDVNDVKDQAVPVSAYKK